MSLENELLRAVSKVGQAAVANALGKNASTISRIFSGEGGVSLGDLDVFLGVLGFKAVPLDDVTVDQVEHQLLCEVAAKFYASKAADLRKAKE